MSFGERVLGIVPILLTFSAPRWYLVEDFGDYDTSEVASWTSLVIGSKHRLWFQLLCQPWAPEVG